MSTATTVRSSEATPVQQTARAVPAPNVFLFGIDLAPDLFSLLLKPAPRHRRIMAEPASLSKTAR